MKKFQALDEFFDKFKNSLRDPLRKGFEEKSNDGEGFFPEKVERKGYNKDK